MQSTMLKAKLHQARVTQIELHYEGSCAIDGDLLDVSGIREYEQIHIYNVSNGERLITYAICGEPGSGMISINGAAAHKASVGDTVIICAYGGYSEAELRTFEPRLVYLDADNSVSHCGHAIAVQAV